MTIRLFKLSFTDSCSLRLALLWCPLPASRKNSLDHILKERLCLPFGLRHLSTAKSPLSFNNAATQLLPPRHLSTGFPFTPALLPIYSIGFSPAAVCFQVLSGTDEQTGVKGSALCAERSASVVILCGSAALTDVDQEFLQDEIEIFTLRRTLTYE